MSNEMRPVTVMPAVYYKNQAWLLNTYIIKKDKNEIISEYEVKSLIERILSVLESSCISNEFQYLKTGFVFLHYGSRGVNLSIWHYGKWGDTYEIYNCSWYCYERNITEMELLDSAEPILSQYEINFLQEELCVFYELLGEISSVDEFRNMYIDKWKRKEICYTL